MVNHLGICVQILDSNGMYGVTLFFQQKKKEILDFPGGLVVKNPANAGETCSSLGLGRFRIP